MESAFSLECFSAIATHLDYVLLFGQPHPEFLCTAWHISPQSAPSVPLILSQHVLLVSPVSRTYFGCLKSIVRLENSYLVIEQVLLALYLCCLHAQCLTTTMGNRHISEDVKQIALKLWNQGWEAEDICDILNISCASLYRRQVIFEEHGSIICPPSPLKGQGTHILTCALIQACQDLFS